MWSFTGRQYDPELGPCNDRARHDHPTLGQFHTRDPLGTWGDPANLGNPYAYVGNNPGSRTDPTGMCPACFGALVGSAAGALWQTGAYGIEVLASGSGWDHQVARERIETGLLVGAATGATGAAGAGVVSGVAAGGASTTTIVGATLAVGAAEGVVGQATIELLEDGTLRGNLHTYANFAAMGAATAGIGYGIGTPTKLPGQPHLAGTLPPDRGFAHEPIPHVLRPGTHFDRIGSEAGVFAAPVGTPVTMRSMPLEARGPTPTTYEVIQPLPVQTGLTLPWYGQEGLGVQYELHLSVQELIAKGVIKKV